MHHRFELLEAGLEGYTYSEFKDDITGVGEQIGDHLLGIRNDLQDFKDQLLDGTNNLSLTIGDAFDSAIETFVASFARPPAPKGDPLVVDIGNNGYDLIGSGSSNVYFDFNGDGIGERTGWVGPEDGFLALDSNNNGVIDNVHELFGDLNQTGFEELAAYDTTLKGGNGDGVINSSDAIFSDLKIWQDLNTDGITDAGELRGYREVVSI